MPELHQIQKEIETETELLSIKPVNEGFIKRALNVEILSQLFKMVQIWSVTIKRLPAILSI